MPDVSRATWDYVREPADGTRLGLSLSGGGIRSATFALGVHQALQEAGIAQRARHVSAVSGGGYLAAGLAISHALSPEELRQAEPAPWGRGSPEEARLRRNLSYLAPGGAGRVWLFANALYGFLLNLVPMLLCAFLAGRLTGTVLGWIHPGLGGSAFDGRVLIWAVALAGVLVLLALGLVAVRRFTDRPGRSPGRSQACERKVLRLFVLAGLALLLGVVVPLVTHLLARSGSHDLAARLGIADQNRVLQRAALALAAIAVAIAVGGLALWLQQRRRWRPLAGALAGLSGGAVLGVPFLLATETAVVRSWEPGRDGVQWLAAALAIGAFAVLAHNRRYSMHLFYRERLQAAFASRRVPLDGDGFDAAAIPYDERILLSEIAARNGEGDEPRFPELIVCAAVAARGEEVPSKTWAASFTFEGRWSGPRRLGLRQPTATIEEQDWIRAGGITLPSMMAISGAAVSPLMGRFTMPAFRLLMALMNVRLGVWIPNPRPREDLSPAPGDGRATRLRKWLGRPWDPCRLARDPADGRLRAASKWIRRGYLEPGAWYVLKEGLGLADLRANFIYVSDGGHWENLGLTELLRRRCTDIVVVDASGDPGLGDIGRAAAVARAELGVELDLDVRRTLAGQDALAETPVVVGKFRYPDGDEGRICYARSVLWEGAPADLHLFAKRETLFPNHPTTNQFLSGELFDAYRALGWAVGRQVVQRATLPPAERDEARADGARYITSPPATGKFAPVT